jgi:hypothetical protein
MIELWWNEDNNFFIVRAPGKIWRYFNEWDIWFYFRYMTKYRFSDEKLWALGYAKIGEL